MIEERFLTLSDDLKNQKYNLDKAIIETQLLEELVSIIEKNDFNKPMESKQDVIDYLNLGLKIKKEWRDCLFNLIKK